MYYVNDIIVLTVHKSEGEKMKKILLTFMLSLVLIFVQNSSVFAMEIENINEADGAVKILTKKQLLDECIVVVEPNVAFVSSTFRPSTDELYVSFGAWGQTGTSNTFYIEKKNSNGVWVVEYKYQLSGGYSKGTSENVIPGDLYRIRVTDNSKYSTWVRVEAYELI